jgi:hypothetical protein
MCLALAFVFSFFSFSAEAAQQAAAVIAERPVIKAVRMPAGSRIGVDGRLDEAAWEAEDIQYDSVSRNLGWQARFRWIVKPGNDIYVVFMNNWLDNPVSGPETLDRNIATKIVYTARF